MPLQEVFENMFFEIEFDDCFLLKYLIKFNIAIYWAKTYQSIDDRLKISEEGAQALLPHFSTPHQICPWMHYNFEYILSQ